jgi:hypothetical protein
VLAGVLGHEISHVVARHTARMIKERRFADLAEAAIDLLTNRDVTAEQVAPLIRQLLLLGYSREHEEQADKLGAIYAARAGYAKDGMLRVQKRFLEFENRYPNPTPWYLSTHPLTKDRMAALEKQLPTLNDETINQVAYRVEEQSGGWWGLLNLGVQYVRAKYMLKSGAQIELADSDNDGIPDTVVRVEGGQSTWYQVAGNNQKGLWRLATVLGNDGKPNFQYVAGYCPEVAEQVKQRALQLLAEGKTEEAIAQLRGALGLGARDADTQLQLAQAYEKAGDKTAAQSAWRGVMRADWRGQSAEVAIARLGGRPSSTVTANSQPAKPALRYEAYNHATKGAVVVAGTRTDWYKVLDAAGEKVLSGEPTNDETELLPGTYLVDLHGVRQTVTVQAGRKTVVEAGSVVVSGTGADWYKVYEATGEKVLADKPTKSETELLPGTYVVKLGERKFTVQVRAKQKTTVNP